MRKMIILLAVCSLQGCATMQDPTFWGAFAAGTAAAEQQQQMQPMQCQSVAIGEVVNTECR